MSFSSFLRERAQAYADNVVATLLLLGGSAGAGWLVKHYGPGLGLEPTIALVLAWVIALLLAVVLSLLLKPKHSSKEPNVDQIPDARQTLKQSGIVNAPRF